jgi:hypothetical protein
MPTSLEDIRLAFEFVGSAYPGANDAILCRRTGKIYLRSEFAGIDEFKDELPDEDADDENYIAIPDKREFGLGKPLALEFARDSRPCWRDGTPSTAGTLSKRRRRTRRCATGARPIQSSSATETAQNFAAPKSAPATD